MAAANTTTNTKTCPTCNQNPLPTPQVLVGWTMEGSGRGTLTLITTCLVTILLCTWVVIHPRVYKQERQAILHKFALFIKAVLGPEFIAVEGLQEYAQCVRMKEACADATGKKFKLVHAFYISMLGLRYSTPQGDRIIWPNQYIWLLKKGLIHWETQSCWGVCEEKIRDTSKADSAAKLITLFQVTWFVAQSIMRTAHALPLSQLESMTISYIPLFAITYFFWWEKPKDIRTPSIIELPSMDPDQKKIFESMAINHKFDDEGLDCKPTFWNVWYLTPRVFEKEEADKEAAEKEAADQQDGQQDGQQDEQQDAEALQRKLRAEIVVSYWDPKLYGSWYWPLICLFGASFGALHLIAWNVAFPTTIEMWLWRASALMSIVSMIVFMHFKKVVFRWGGPLTIISLVSPVLYFLSRVIMLGQAFAALRAEEPAVYDTYVVSTYWAHLL